MSPFITTKHNATNESRHNRPQESVRLLVSLNVAVIAFALIAALVYVWLLNLVVSDSYLLKNLEQRLGVLQETEEGLHRDISVLRSPETLSLRVSALGLVASESMSYPSAPTAVARSGGTVLP